jgi:hypothetical protein
MNQPVEFALIHAKLFRPFGEGAAIELGQEASRVLRTSLQPDQLIQGLFEKLTIRRHRHTSPWGA